MHNIPSIKRWNCYEYPVAKRVFQTPFGKLYVNFWFLWKWCPDKTYRYETYRSETYRYITFRSERYPASENAYITRLQPLAPAGSSPAPAGSSSAPARIQPGSSPAPARLQPIAGAGLWGIFTGWSRLQPAGAGLCRHFWLQPLAGAGWSRAGAGWSRFQQL